MSEYGAQERAAIVLSMLHTGPQTAKAMADATGLSVRSVYYLLDNICGPYPITNSNGVWYMLTTEEQLTLWHIMRRFERELENSHTGQAFSHALPMADIVRLLPILRRFVVAPVTE